MPHPSCTGPHAQDAAAQHATKRASKGGRACCAHPSACSRPPGGNKGEGAVGACNRCCGSSSCAEPAHTRMHTHPHTPAPCLQKKALPAPLGIPARMHLRKARGHQTPVCRPRRGAPGAHHALACSLPNTPACPSMLCLLALGPHVRFHIHTRTCAHTYTHTHKRMHTCTCTCACTHMRVRTLMHICTHKRTYTYAHAHIDAHTHMHKCTHPHVHTCRHMHMHVYTHMHVPLYARVQGDSEADYSQGLAGGGAQDAATEACQARA